MFFFVFIVVVVCFAVFLCSIYRSSFRHRSFLSTYFVSTCVNRRKRQTEQTEEWGWGENEKFILLMPAISVMEFENSIVRERMKQHWHVSVMMMRTIVSRMLTAFYDHQHKVFILQRTLDIVCMWWLAVAINSCGSFIYEVTRDQYDNEVGKAFPPAPNRTSFKSHSSW